MNLKEKSFEYARMRESDIPSVKKIEIENNLAPWTIEDYRKEVYREDSLAYTASVNGEIIGFIIARLITLQNLKSILSENKTENSGRSIHRHRQEFKHEIEIYNICVVRQHRKNGVGKTLFETILNKTPHQISNIWLEVRKSNHGAIEFYKNLNFQIISQRKFFYRNPSEDGLVLKLEMRQSDI